MDDNSYLSDNWNRMDFMIVIFTIVDLSLAGNNSLPFVKVIRLMRVLRPLRFISKN